MDTKAKYHVQGEGDYSSAKRYNESQRAFIKAGEVEQALSEASQQSEEEGKRARREAASRAKQHDPRELHNK